MNSIVVIVRLYILHGSGSSPVPIKCLDESLFALSDISLAIFHGIMLPTLHGLLTSKPGGASGLSVCPRAKPVSRRSRSNTVNGVSIRHEVIVRYAHFAVQMLAGAGLDPNTAPCTHLVPLIHASSSPLAAVLDLLELSNRHGAECEELQRPLASLSRSQLGDRGLPTYAGHDGIGQQSLEGNAHGCGGVRAGLLVGRGLGGEGWSSQCRRRLRASN